MTVSVPPDAAVTLDDLDAFPDDGRRHEIIEGSLLVSPAPALPHGRALTYLHRLLIRQAPDDYIIGQNIGVLRHAIKQTYLIPDMLVIRAGTLDRDGNALLPAEVLVAVEALSPSSTSVDTVLKLLHYARMGIPQYWIVDPGAAALTVLRVPDGDAYKEKIVVRAGTTWTTDDPFDIKLDPADFC
jgi:Uma2 family endonuclease